MPVVSANLAPIVFGPTEEQKDLSRGTPPRPVFEDVLQSNPGGRPVSIDIVRTTVKLDDPKQRQALATYLSQRLQGSGLSRAQIETALTVDGPLKQAIRSGRGDVAVYAIEQAANPPAPVVLQAVPPPAGPTPGALSSTLQVAPVELPASAVKAPPDLRTLQYNAYRGALDVIETKLKGLQSKPVSVEVALQVRALTKARNQLNIAASHLREAAIPAPKMDDASGLAHSAWVIHTAAYAMALSLPVTIYDVQREMPHGAFSDKSCIPAATIAAHEAQAQRVADMAFGTLTGDPLGEDYYGTVPEMLAALK